jgi:hypothetical protein
MVGFVFRFCVLHILITVLEPKFVLSQSRIRIIFKSFSCILDNAPVRVSSY